MQTYALTSVNARLMNNPTPFGNNIRSAGLPSGTVRERHGSAKLTESAVNEIRSSDLSGVALARKFGVHEGTISRVRLGQTWTAKPLPPKKSTLRAKQGEKT